MALKSDLTHKINSYFNEPYEVSETKIVPSTDYSKLTFGNKALVSELCFLFVDIRKSSKLHSTYGWKTAARIYQSFHDITLRNIERKDGKVRAFDGDRIMGVFSGDFKCSNACEAALKIKWSVINLLNPKIKTPLSIGVGVDYGKTMITKVGKGRDSNNSDLVWIGKACNHASHLSSFGNNSTYISKGVYNKINDSSKYSDKGENMWTSGTITIKNEEKVPIYYSRWGWVLN